MFRVQGFGFRVIRSLHKTRNQQKSPPSKKLHGFREVSSLRDAPRAPPLLSPMAGEAGGVSNLSRFTPPPALNPKP